MNHPVRVAVAGLGRMGIIHALHISEIARETGKCTLAALCDALPDRARKVATDLGCDVPIYSSIEELGDARVADATVIVTPTDQHRASAGALIARGHRVLVEKPLTESLASDLAFAAELDKSHPHAVMLGFQRRFDAGLQYAKELARRGPSGASTKSTPRWKTPLPPPTVT